MSAEKRHINLMRGWPSPGVLPAALLSSACQRILAGQDEYTAILQYGPSAGYPALRHELSKWLGQHYNVNPNPDRICVTGGASQGLSCILQSFSDPNYTRAVWIIAPCYYLACGIFEDSGLAGKLRAYPEDDEGIDLMTLENRIRKVEMEEKSRPQLKVSLPNNASANGNDESLVARLNASQPLKIPGPTRKLYRHIIYIVPTCANPSGKTMSVQRREGLVRLARKYDALVVCDDVYDLLQWSLNSETQQADQRAMRLPRLCDIELAMGFADVDERHFGYTISNGSFSKIAGPGVRTGWVEASPNFVVGLGDTASTLSGGAPSQLCAAILSETLRTSALQKHIQQKSCPSLQRRHRLVMNAIQQYILPLGYHTRETSLLGARIYGGYFIWLTPEEGITLSSKLVAEVAVGEENLAIGYGCMFEVRGDEESAQFRGDIRLCFAWEPEDVMIEGIERLGRLLKRMLDDKTGYENWGSKRAESNFVNSYK
ncbi:Valine--pyruvate aminotransferase [Conoideocrella luteorostrata]|uniref:Valine--pyruvate aminotransferase n=1 Tax=Conoideocrella luteorostrata TaxID=1105319 RepID=A0AAJ0FYD1_9HYPO|nr:Valine--pyruvate aminotransferase [Conoideocrella luteorostrata]